MAKRLLIIIPTTKYLDENYPIGKQFLLLDIDGVQYGLFNIDEIERRTDYDFFSNIPEDIQSIIESRDVGSQITPAFDTIRGKINSIKPAPLMAASFEDEELPFAPVGTFLDSSIRHGSMQNQITTTTESVFGSIGTLEIGASQDRILNKTDLSITKASVSSIHQSQNSSVEISTSATSLNQTNGIEISSFQDSVLKSGKKQTSPKEIGFSQISFLEHSTSQVGSTQANSSQVGTFKSMDFPRTIINVPLGIGNQLNPIKITLPSIVSLQQLNSGNLPNSIFPTHDLISNYLSQLQSTLPIYWNIPTDLNINFQITNLYLVSKK